VGMSAVGILGGAFDPPHLGHVALAREGVRHFGLARLLVRVVASPGHKQVRTDPQVRLELASLAFAALPDAEVALDPHARTVDSLRELALDDPVFLVGADEFAAFPAWKDPDGVLELARVGVATRPGVSPHPEAVLSGLARPDRVSFFSIEPLPVSSAEIRAVLASGGSVAGLVPPAVAAAIDRLGLYRDG
jgi:nicotinate-nucleotide adenylyltransferase